MFQIDTVQIVIFAIVVVGLSILIVWGPRD
jgi:hypothetical protein